jgi:hypothetical protein
MKLYGLLHEAKGGAGSGNGSGAKDGGTGSGGSGAAGGAGGDGGKPPLTFETFLESQSDEVKGLVESHTRGLKAALESEREGRKAQAKQLAELAKKAEKGSEAEKALTEAATQAKAAESRATFYASAHAAGVQDLELAYLAAQRDGLLSDSGSCDLESLKKRHPSLFVGSGASSAAGAAGAGTRQQTTGGSMNDWIRERVRRG